MIIWLFRFKYFLIIRERDRDNALTFIILSVSIPRVIIIKEPTILFPLYLTFALFYHISQLGLLLNL